MVTTLHYMCIYFRTEYFINIANIMIKYSDNEKFQESVGRRGPQSNCAKATSAQLAPRVLQFLIAIVFIYLIVDLAIS